MKNSLKNFTGRYLQHEHYLKSGIPGVINSVEQCKIVFDEVDLFDLYIGQAHNQYTVTFNVMFT